jgi:hypothetical protein
LTSPNLKSDNDLFFERKNKTKNSLERERERVNGIFEKKREESKNN